MEANAGSLSGHLERSRTCGSTQDLTQGCVPSGVPNGDAPGFARPDPG